MENKTSNFPDWVNKHRKSGTEIRRFGTRYYVYEAKGFYDKKRKKSRKKTGKYLGTIDETAVFIEAKTKRVPKSYKGVDTCTTYEVRVLTSYRRKNTVLAHLSVLTARILPNR